MAVYVRHILLHNPRWEVMMGEVLWGTKLGDKMKRLDWLANNLNQFKSKGKYDAITFREASDMRGKKTYNDRIILVNRNPLLLTFKDDKKMKIFGRKHDSWWSLCHLDMHIGISTHSYYRFRYGTVVTRVVSPSFFITKIKQNRSLGKKEYYAFFKTGGRSNK